MNKRKSQANYRKSTIIANSLTKLPRTSGHSLPSKDKLTRQKNYQRSKLLGDAKSAPSYRQEIIIPEQLQVTYSGNNFLLIDTGKDDPDRMIILANEENIRLPVIGDPSKRHVPNFQIKYWNVYKRVWKDLPRTIKNIEAWHKTLSQDIECHPTFLKLLKHLRREKRFTEHLFDEIKVGKVFGRPKKEIKKIKTSKFFWKVTIEMI
ncbi:unnamed protein product [Brachionus calyciflorus]|uniref:Uncharacterized protein n=1 Tax=Brachionus calyciflorus TaxID=104777 RepID=A0A814DMQ9_9BILA|nr:unnamed protein product [Brachionus calyciflorus]